MSSAIPPHTEGRCATSSTRGGMRWTRAALKTRALSCGPRRRVVLTPRRWRQVCGDNSAGDGGKKARSPGRARNKLLKPLRAGMLGVSGEPVVTTLVFFLHLHARLRVHRAPGIPHALDFRGEGSLHNSGKSRREIAELCKMNTNAPHSQPRQLHVVPDRLRPVDRLS